MGRIFFVEFLKGGGQPRVLARGIAFAPKGLYLSAQGNTLRITRKEKSPCLGGFTGKKWLLNGQGIERRRGYLII